MSGEVKAGAGHVAGAEQPEDPAGARRRRRDADRSAARSRVDRRDGRQGADGHDHPRGRPPRRHPHPDAVPPPGPVRRRRLPRLRGRGRGQRTLQAACAFPITRSLKVQDPHARRCARRGATSSTCCSPRHYGECYSLHAQQQLRAAGAGQGIRRRLLPLRPRRPSRGTPIDESSYSVVRDMNKCVLCRRCVRTCIDFQEVGVLEAIGRGDRTRISTFLDKPLADVVCINCGQCINRCPTGALHANDPTDEVWARHRRPDQARRHPDRAEPAGRHRRVLRAASPGTPLTFQMNTALKLRGFDKVFDTNFTADLTIIEEGTELLVRLYKALVKGEQVAFAAVHELLARLGEVPRALLPRVHPEPLVGQEPAADVRRAHQDLLRRSSTTSTRRTSSPSRSCRARPRSSSATGRRWPTAASRTWTTA